MTKTNLSNILVVVGYVVACILFQTILPWYIIIICALVSAYFITAKPLQKISLFFLLGFIIWGISAYYIDHQSSSRLSSRIGVLFGDQKPAVLIGISGLIAAISSAFGAWCGTSLSTFVRGK